jgi:hypothetical protein
MLTWTNEHPTLAGFFWFKGSLEGKLTHRQVVMATMVEVTRLDEQFITWFPRGEGPMPLRDCHGRWVGPIEVPR